MLAGDLVQLGIQASQVAEIEAFGSSNIIDKGRQLAERGDAWTASYGGRVVACGGFLEQHAHEAVAWVAIAAEICPAASFSVVRFARRQVAGCWYKRLEALVDADNDRAVAFVKAIGFEVIAVLRHKGAVGNTQLFCERVA